MIKQEKESERIMKHWYMREFGQLPDYATLNLLVGAFNQGRIAGIDICRLWYLKGYDVPFEFKCEREKKRIIKNG